MAKVLRSIGLAALCIVLLMSLAACDDDKPTQTTETTGVISGMVSGAGKVVLEGVSVTVGTKTSLTDAQGKFVLSGIEPGADVRVDFAKAGLIPVQKVVSVSKGRTTYTTATMLAPQVVTFAAISGTTIPNGSSEIQIPAEAFETGSGMPFTGSVLAETRFFDPTNLEDLNAFPGNFVGEQTDGTETMFESYGFVYAAFFDATDPNVNLYLRDGKTAQITSLIPSSLLAGAPETIPMWWYDESDGKWKEDGSATKTGNYYQCNVEHFTYWNFDHPITITDQSTLTGTVISSTTKGTVAGAQVVATGVNYSGYTRVYSEADGTFSITVKASAQVTVQALYGTSISTPTAIINTPASGTSLAIGDLSITDMSFNLTGTLVNSDGDPIGPGYGQIYQVNPPAGSMPFQGWINMDANGDFLVNTMYAGTMSSFNIQFMFNDRGQMYSNQISFTVPGPGQTRDFGDITMKPGGTVTGRAKLNTGAWLANQSISFMQEGGQGEGSFFHATTDADGNFSLVGPFSTTLTDMIGSTWIDNVSYASPARSITFPASGQSSDIGTVTFSPAQ